MKASAMTGRSPAAVRRLARGLRRIALSGGSMAEPGTAGARWPWRLTALYVCSAGAAEGTADLVERLGGTPALCAILRAPGTLDDTIDEASVAPEYSLPRSPMRSILTDEMRPFG